MSARDNLCGLAREMFLVFALSLMGSVLCSPVNGQQLSAFNDRAVAPVNTFNPSQVVLAPIAYGPVRVCTVPASGSPCTPLAAIFDLNGNPLSVVGGNFGQLQTTVTGQFSFECTPGVYLIQVAAASSNTPQLQYQAACPVTTTPGTVTSFSAGNLSPLFTSSVATPTTTPALSFALNSQSANSVFAAPNGSSGNPTFRGIVAADLPTLPSFQINGGTSSGIFAVSGGSPSTFGGAVNYTTSGTSGGIPYFSSSTTVSSTGTLSANAVLIGGGLSGAVTNIPSDTNTTHALFATSGAPAFRSPAASDFGTQTANTFLAAPNASSGSPSFRAIAAADLPSGIPVADLAAGTSGQCVNTSGTVVVWGSCAGTAGVQTLFTNASGATVGAATTSAQTLDSSFSGFVAGSLNSVGKTVRITTGGSYTVVNTSQTVKFGLTLDSGAPFQTLIPASAVGTTNFYTIVWTCMTITTGASGSMTCIAQGGSQNIPGNGGSPATPIAFSGTVAGLNLTATLSATLTVQFSVTASTSNAVTESWMIIEQMN